MLLKKITYPDDFPINIRLLTIHDIPLHFHNDIEFVFVLRGSIRLTSGYCGYDLKAGDIFTNNGHEIHSLHSEDPENIVAVLQISNGFFAKYFPTLGKSYYRTNSLDGSGGRQDDLRRMLLRVILDYLRKSLNYKNQCIYETIDLIKYLNKYFNLFTLSDRVVVTVEDDNPLTIERLSRIIGYIYDNYRSKVTLENISELEHLSTFYLSHLIKDYTGMNFRDFLCFVRVERSEIELLDTDKKVSRIAKDMGFSTTAYYRKFFEHWYGRSPEEHRRIFRPLVMGPLNPEHVDYCSSSVAIGITTGMMYGLDNVTKYSTAERGAVDISLDADAEAVASTPGSVLIETTEEDRRVLGPLCDTALLELSADEVRLSTSGYGGKPVYGWDTIAAPLHVLRSFMTSDRLTAQLRDQGDVFPLFKGRASLLTSGGLRKPVYYAYMLLSRCKGDIISLGSHHAVIRRSLEGNPDAFYLVCLNYDDRIDKLCTLSSSLHETAEILSDFKSILDLSVNVKLPPGDYAMARYSLNEENNLFSYMNALGFPGQRAVKAPSPADLTLLAHLGMMNTAPYSNMSRSAAKGTASVSFSIKGPGMELVVLQKLRR